MRIGRLQLFGLLMGCAGPYFSTAQHTLSVRVTELPTAHAGETIYITGNFNRWNPAQEQMMLVKQADGSYGISVLLKDVPSDRLEFKFTRGNWQSSECTAQGRLVGPRLATLDRDTTITCQIEGWRDDFPASTASSNVHLLDSAFYIPQLDRYRKIWIYLPENYQTSNERYPVLYMQDGQHLFDEATSQGRIGPIEWGVDEVIDTASEKCIVVAINHQTDYKDRLPEYYFRTNEDYKTVEGPQYIDFIVKTLKPHIDSQYRTLPDQTHTGLAGSSMGGLITFYGGLAYPDVFGTIGVFSPSIWLDHGNIEHELTTRTNRTNIHRQRYYFYAGMNENRLKPDSTFVHMYDDVQRAIGLLKKAADPEIKLSAREDGRHGALYWREAFPAFYQWFIAGTKKAIY
ncbi:phosphonate ABC transporter ATP-binding protein [Parapedobacter pyrenivorans]|uniref:Phosphonate ABC transporter ATP-binding protein n=1 Tax=Parapedobacter pyrenivorans TaxID=1305674 RepID=A0A917HDB8_9SPHI|nr:alpha/beta hydrolase-fold protein [Parapedobacter pyrenivorans]GGG74714.1 phosphonate ABC transporter ATP-binding protein [Parapedobacter pyrenivorans]